MKRTQLTIEVSSARRDDAVRVRIVALDQCGMTLEVEGAGKTPDWVIFTHTVHLCLSLHGGTPVNMVAGVVRARIDLMPGAFVVRLRKLDDEQVDVLEQYVGAVGPAAVRAAKKHRPARPLAAVRPGLPPRQDERRQHPRYPIDAQMWVVHRNITHVWDVTDISRGGLRCELSFKKTPRWVRKGMKIRMRLFPEGGQDIHIYGRIVHVERGSDLRPTWFGVSFEEVAAQTLVSRLIRRVTLRGRVVPQ